MTSWVQHLKEWQELAGAIIGGVIALFVALIVAHDARRRSERSAAMMLGRHLLKLIACWVHAQTHPEGRERGDYISVMFPHIPEQYAGSLAAVATVHVHLAAHLNAVEYISADIARILEARERLVAEAHKFPVGSLVRTNLDEEIAARDATLAKWVRMGAEHATCAERLLGVLVFSWAAMSHRLRLKVWPSAVERICRDGLNAGAFATSPIGVE